MGETGISRFQGNLDPRAQEFRPTTLFRPPQVYYPYGAASPPTLPPYASNDVQVVPFGGVGYAQYPTHPQLGVPLPPPSTGPTRTLVLSYVPGDVSETIVRRDLEVFGEVRGVQMERLMEGIVTVHFYDLRHAEMAFKEIREQHMQLQLQQQSYGLKNPYSSGLMLMNNDNNNNSLATGCYDNQVVAESLMIMNSYAPVLPLPARGLVAGRPVWAQFIVPTCNAVPDGNNQGTIVVFNLDSGVSSSTLKEIFQVFGPVKELRETPLKKHQRFIEFYDVRDAAKALKEMNGQEIYGKHVVIEFSRPGGHSKKFFYANSTSCASSLNYSTIYQTRNSDCPPPPFSADPPSYSPRSFVSQAPHFRKKSPSNSFKGNPNNVNVTCSIEPSLASLSLANAIEDININPARRSSKKSQSYQSIVSIAKSQQVRNRSRPWKGKHAKKIDARFLISEDATTGSNCRDSRTTVMVKNIPNKYSQKLLLNMLDNHCIHCNEQIAEGDDRPLSSYDFVYLPIDFNNKCNVGYGFVNMTSPEATWRLYKAFHLQNWEVFNSRKICEVTYARVQGLEALKEHFKNSKFPSEMDHYLPVVFSPPRDGRRQLTEPLPIVGLGLDHNKQCMSVIGDVIGHSLANPNVVTDLGDHHDSVDGSDTLDTANNSESDYADQTHLLIGGSCSSSSTNGGDVVDDDDRDSSSSAVLAPN